MLTVDTYAGTAEELADFLHTVWANSYSGKMTFIHWSAEYLRWQLRFADGRWPENVLAVYDGPKLAGTLLGFDQDYRSAAGIHSGSMWSWLSIHPEYRGRGIAKLLDEERVRRLKAKNSQLIASYRYVGSKHSQARSPLQDAGPSQQCLKLGMWIRILKPNPFTRWHANWIEGVLAVATGPFAPVPKKVHTAVTIRPYAANDLDACVSLLNDSQAPAEFAIHWDHASLSHQLSGSPVTQTLVLTVDDQIRGLINFHVLPFEARTVENVGVIDLIAFRGVGSRAQACLIDAAMAWMNEQGAILTLKLRSGDCPIVPLARNGFVPQKAESYLVLRWLGQPATVRAGAPVHLIWR